MGLTVVGAALLACGVMLVFVGSSLGLKSPHDGRGFVHAGETVAICGLAFGVALLAVLAIDLADRAGRGGPGRARRGSGRVPAAGGLIRLPSPETGLDELRQEPVVELRLASRYPGPDHVDNRWQPDMGNGAYPDAGNGAYPDAGGSWSPGPAYVWSPRDEWDSGGEDGWSPAEADDWARDGQGGWDPAGQGGWATGGDHDWGLAEPAASRAKADPLLADTQAKLEQIKDLYQTAEAIGEDALVKHFDQLSQRQSSLIREFFEHAGLGSSRTSALLGGDSADDGASPPSGDSTQDGASLPG